VYTRVVTVTVNKGRKYAGIEFEGGMMQVKGRL
jgi:hypothetical protein